MMAKPRRIEWPVKGDYTLKLFTKLWMLKVFFEKRNVWVGVYWSVTRIAIDIHVCVIPCCTVHIMKVRR